MHDSPMSFSLAVIKPCVWGCKPWSETPCLLDRMSILYSSLSMVLSGSVCDNVTNINQTLMKSMSCSVMECRIQTSDKSEWWSCENGSGLTKSGSLFERGSSKSEPFTGNGFFEVESLGKPQFFWSEKAWHVSSASQMEALEIWVDWALKDAMAASNESKLNRRREEPSVGTWLFWLESMLIVGIPENIPLKLIFDISLTKSILMSSFSFKSDCK